MEKYRLFPKQNNAFWTQVQDMDMTVEEASYLKCGRIRHVEVIPQLRTWEILLWTGRAFSELLQKKVETHIAAKNHLQTVILHLTLINLEDSLEKHWERIVDAISHGSPTVRNLLLNGHKLVKGTSLVVQVRGEIGKLLLEEHDVPQLLSRVTERIVGYPCHVELQAIHEEMVHDEDFEHAYEKTEDYQRALSAVQSVTSVRSEGNGYGANNGSETAQGSGTAKASAAYGGNSSNGSSNSYGNNGYNSSSNGYGSSYSSRRTNANKNAPESIAAGGNSDLFFGRGINGDFMTISEAYEQQGSVIIQGVIGSVDGRSFKTTNLITFTLADDSEGVICKCFFKEMNEFEAVLGALKGGVKKGITMKVKGNLRYDNFVNDFTLMCDSALKIKTHGRMDLSEEKRVELHCHTTMSDMDGVTPASRIIKQAADWGWPAIAITDHGVVQAYPEAMNTAAKLDIKIIYGMEGYIVDDPLQKKANHIILLAKTPLGLRNLYQLVSWSHLRFFHRNRPRLPRRLIQELREGIIVGSACEAGELIRTMVSGASEEELEKIADFYDFLEIQPIGNNAFLKRSEDFPAIKTDEDLKQINICVAKLAKKLKKPLIATCDVHFLNPEDSIYRAILMKGKGFADADLQPPLYLRTTEEMLAEFTYLGEELAYEAVVTNPRRLADSVEKFKPIPDDDKLYSPMIPGADEDITNMTYENAHKLYGEELPEIVQARIDQELKPIIAHGFAVLYLIAHKLVKKSNIDGYLVGSRGSVGSSFVATMTGITEVNPLPPHWRCPHCKYTHFVTDGSYGCGYDLPDKDCPVCGTPMVKDGHDIPFAVFLGFDGDKVPDIDLNFSGLYQPVAHKYCEELFGKDNVFKAGSIGTVAEKTAYGFVKKYYEEKGQKKREPYINKVAQGCNGVKRTTGQHPAGIMVVPRNMDVHFFTPLQHPANDMTSDITTTHFDYHSISSRLVKLDILGHDDPTVIKMLEDLTHRDPKTIPFDDPVTLSLFSSTNALGLTPDELGATSGTFGIPEFRTSFTRQMIDDTHPSCFSDLVRISGFSHGTDVWLGNAQDLIRAGTCTLQDAISARDDIMMYLIHNGVDPLLSFKTMEKVRKGKGIAEDVVEKLREKNIPEWYIQSCQKIKYMFPRAHATAYVMMAYRIAFCKVHYPLAYYAAYFSIRAAAFDADLISKGQEVVKQAMDDLNGKDKLDAKESELLIVLQLAWEMYLRGYSLEKVNLYESQADKFVMREKSLLPPFTSLNGLGGSDAASLVEGRKGNPFTSIENLKKRTGVSRTTIEALRNHGCLNGLDESDQLSLFG